MAVNEEDGVAGLGESEGSLLGREGEQRKLNQIESINERRKPSCFHTQSCVQCMTSVFLGAKPITVIRRNCFNVIAVAT